MPLHPEIAEELAAVAALGLKPLKDISPAQARCRAEAEARPAGKAVYSVETIGIPVSGGAIAARLYRPFVAEELPVIVYYHGGGFVLGSLDTYDNVCRNLCADTGAIVVSVDYRLAPEHRFPVASDDALMAVRFLEAEAGRLGIDPARMLVAGDSAGGNLAAVTALRLRDEGGPSLAGQLLVYPATDHFSAGRDSYRAYAEGFGLTADDMVWFWDHYAPAPAQYLDPRASPLRAADLTRLPPALVASVEYDVLRDEGEVYADRLQAAGVPVERRRFAGLAHGCLNAAGKWKCVEPLSVFLADWARNILAD